jgi:hypothetical protein
MNSPVFCDLSQHMHRTDMSDDGVHISNLTRLRFNDYGQVTLLRTGCCGQKPMLLPPR